MEYMDKICILYNIIFKDHNAINAYLQSKEYADHLITEKPIFYNEFICSATVASKITNEEYTVIIDFVRDIYYCTCNSYVFKRYEIVIPDEYKNLFWRRTIAICPHILKIIEYLYRKKLLSKVSPV